MGELTAFSTMFLVGNISAPPTVGSFIWALAAKEVMASAAPAMRVSSDFFIWFPFQRLLLLIVVAEAQGEEQNMLLCLAVRQRRTSYLRG